MRPPMLAQAGSVAALRSDRWAFEGKWDGNRLLIEATPDELTFWTRQGRDVTSEYPRLFKQLDETLDGYNLVLDGEVVALDEAGVPRFNEVQNHRRSQRVFFWAFDLVEVEGQSVANAPYRERRNLLERVGKATGVVVPPLIPFETGAEALAWTRQNELEGVVAKRLDSPYQWGKRGALWIKDKNWFTQTVVVGGFQYGAGRRAGTVGSLLMGVPGDDGQLRYVGKVGTGFTDADLAHLLDLLVPLRIGSSPFVPNAAPGGSVFVEPKLTGEVQYSERTASGILRQPSWQGLRNDKSPADVREETA